MAAAKSFAIVTGANRGVGLALTKQLVAAGYDVMAVCRKASSELTAAGCSSVVEGADLGRPEGADVVVKAVAAAGSKVDLLINNAGILREESLDDMKWGGIQEQLDVNFFGPMRLTHALLPHMREGGASASGSAAVGAKVAMVTSQMGSIADNTSGGMYGYRCSKAALNMASVSLAHDLKPRGIALALLHPGFVETDMTARWGEAAKAHMISTDASATGILARVAELNLDNSGTFMRAATAEVIPW